MNIKRCTEEGIEVIALIDGDVACYRACYRDLKIRQNNVFTNLDNEGVECYSKEEDKECLERSWKNFKKDLREMLDNLYITEYFMAVKGVGNFRNMLFPGYKNRKRDPNRVDIVSELRKRAVKEASAIYAHGREADDLIRIWAKELENDGKEYVTCTIDKDLKNFPGKYFNMKHKTLETITKEDALRSYYTQILQGDSVDSIPGVPGIGPVTAKEILAPYHKEEDFQEKLVEQYLLAYGEEWPDYLLINAKLIHLQTHPNDYFSYMDWPIIKELLW